MNVQRRIAVGRLKQPVFSNAPANRPGPFLSETICVGQLERKGNPIKRKGVNRIVYGSIPFHANPSICTTGADGRPNSSMECVFGDAHDKLVKQVRKLARKSARAVALSDKIESRKALLKVFQKHDEKIPLLGVGLQSGLNMPLW